MHATSLPSEWVTRWAHLIRPQGHVLDVACGSGRHSHWLAQKGFHVTGVDRDAQALTTAQALWPADATPTEQWLLADIENQPWPLGGQTFDALVTTHYLWRPLWPSLLAALAPGGVYIHETFAHGNATVGKPSRPDFLLQPGELLTACAGLRVVAFEDGFCTTPDRFVQRIVAVRDTTPASAPPARHHLTQPRPLCAG
jgi:SAM-dependent methyltransferase